MNSVPQHRGNKVLTGVGIDAAAAMYFGRIAWQSLLKPTTPGEWNEMT